MKQVLSRYVGPIVLGVLAVAFSLSHLPYCGAASAICSIVLAVAITRP